MKVFCSLVFILLFPVLAYSQTGLIENSSLWPSTTSGPEKQGSVIRYCVDGYEYVIVNSNHRVAITQAMREGDGASGRPIPKRCTVEK